MQARALSAEARERQQWMSLARSASDAAMQLMPPRRRRFMLTPFATRFDVLFTDKELTPKTAETGDDKIPAVSHAIIDLLMFCHRLPYRRHAQRFHGCAVPGFSGAILPAADPGIPSSPLAVCSMRILTPVIADYRHRSF